MSPADPNRIAYTLAGESGFGIGVSDLGTGGDAVLVDRDVFAEIVGWNDDGGSVRYFATAPTGSLRLRPAPGGRVFSGTGMGQPNDDESTLFAALDDEHELSLTAQEIDTETLTSNYAISDIPAGFPKVGRGSHVPLEFQPDAVGDGGTSTARSFTIRSADGVHSVSGDDIAGVGRIVIGGSGGDRTAVPGPAVLSKVLRNGLIVKEFEPDRTVTKYVNWAGEATQLGATAVNYHLPEANSTMVQGGAAYSSPGNCNVAAHFENMAYAYDFRNQTVGAHALAVADGLAVFTSSTMACNFLQQSCPDYSANGCPGFYLGNQVIIQHSDGTYSVFSHLQTNSIQVAVGASACQGQYVARQGHTGSVTGTFNNCGDHLHYQRQVTPDVAGQSIPATFSDVAVHPLSCGSAYSTSSTEIVHSIGTSSRSFGVAGGNATVNVTSNGCSWDAFSRDSWITIVSPSGGGGSGPGAVSYTVSNNSAGGARTGTMVIGGRVFTVTQSGGGVTNAAPAVDAGADQTVTIVNGAALSGSVTDDGLPAPSSITSTWSKAGGPGSVTFTDAGSPATSAMFSIAGIYTLRLTATDGQLTGSDDVRIIVNVAGAGGVLTAAPGTAPTSVDLTSEGTADWVHWGLADETSVDRKNGVTPQISNFSRLGTVNTLRCSTNGSITYAWSDGTPNTGPLGTTSCVYVYGIDNGFEFILPADTAQRTFKLYVGVWRVTGRLEAEMSDSGASPAIDNSLATFYPSSSALNGVYTITYAAASAGQTLKVRWFIESNTYPVGNINIQSATLKGGTAPPPNQAPVLNAGADQFVSLPANATLSGTATDDGLPSPPSLLTTTWSQVSGPATVTFGDANALNTTATFSTTGVYVLRLTASDGAASVSDDMTVSVTIPGQGSLSVSQGAISTNVNLSTEGTSDWAHWGLTTPTSFNHKNGITQQISNYSVLGTGLIQRYTNNPNLYSWSGGTPTASASNTATGLYVIGVNNGFQITAPADTTIRTLKMYVGCGRLAEDSKRV